MKANKEITDWLTTSEPWTEYNTEVNLLLQEEDSEEVLLAKKRMSEHPLVKELLMNIQDWPGYALKRHNDAKHHTHKLALLADIGLKKTDSNIESIANQIFRDQSEEGAFQVITNIPTHFGGSGKDELGWMLCDSPTVLYSLLKFGYIEDKRVEKAIEYIASLIRDNGWPCAVHPKYGKFKGPGRKNDPCPYANLISLKVLASHPKWTRSEESKIGAETILSLWDLRKEKRPFLFAMGTKFSKLKAPFIWYDILHVTNVLTKFDWLRNDERLHEMINLIKDKADEIGRFTAESVWRAYKEWDFGQKREPSPWITYQVYKIMKRI